MTARPDDAVRARDISTGEVIALARDGDTLSRRAVPEPEAAPSAHLSPGWIDVQVNGFAGHDVNAGNLDPEGFEALTRALHAEGVARYLPTVVTAEPAHMGACLGAVAAARRASPAVAAAVPGVHLEGPFVSPEEGARGAHPREAVRDPDPTLFDELQAHAEGAIRLVTLAPERPGALELVKYLAHQGIVVAVGHSLADAELIHEAADAGARLSTHLGNGVPRALPRHPNLLWAQLAEDRLWASMIFDGHHLPVDTMRTFLRAKGPDRALLTSDAAALAGCRPGVYRGHVGGTVELHPDGCLTMQGSAYLAGSASSLRDGVATALGPLGLDAGAAARLVADGPRQLLGLGAADDHTVFDWDGHAVTAAWTVLEGRVVYDASQRAAP